MKNKLSAFEIGLILVFVITIVIMGAVILTGCNKQVIDLTYNFNYAYIILPNNTVVQGKVESWTDYQDGDQLQVKIDGVTYLVHSSDCVLVSDPNLN